MPRGGQRRTSLMKSVEGPWDGSQVVRRGGKEPHSRNLLTGPQPSLNSVADTAFAPRGAESPTSQGGPFQAHARPQESECS